MLTAEEKRRDGSFHAGDRRNEALDCRVMNLAAGDIFLDTLLEAERMKAREHGFDRHQVLAITKRHILEKLEQTIAPLMGAQDGEEDQGEEDGQD